MTKKVVNTLQNYYGMAIRQNVESLYAMKKSVLAIVFHCSENKDIEVRSHIKLNPGAVAHEVYIIRSGYALADIWRDTLADQCLFSF